MFFIAVWIAYIVEDMVTFVIVTGSSSQTYQRNILVARFLRRCPNIFNIAEDNDGKETKAETLDISNLNNEILFSSQIEH